MTADIGSRALPRWFCSVLYSCHLRASVRGCGGCRSLWSTLSHNLLLDLAVRVVNQPAVIIDAIA